MDFLIIYRLSHTTSYSPQLRPNRDAELKCFSVLSEEPEHVQINISPPAHLRIYFQRRSFIFPPAPNIRRYPLSVSSLPECPKLPPCLAPFFRQRYPQKHTPVTELDYHINTQKIPPFRMPSTILQGGRTQIDSDIDFCGIKNRNIDISMFLFCKNCKKCHFWQFAAPFGSQLRQMAF